MPNRSFEYPIDLPSTLQALILQALERHKNRPLLIFEEDNSIFKYEDVEKIIQKTAARLTDERISKGDVVCSYAALNLESILLFWASMLLGVIFIPFDYNWPSFLITKTIQNIKPKLFFCDSERYPEIDDANEYPIIIYDDHNANHFDTNSILFSDWISQPCKKNEHTSLIEISSEDTAVILFTSGTTSVPKGVMLSHGSLTRSGWLVKKAFDFRENDVLYSLGELNAMSGLRNPCIATLFAGNSVLITAQSKRSNLFFIADSIHLNECTLLSTAPAVIRQLNEYYNRLPEKKLQSLRMVFSTGSDLSHNEIEDFENRYHLKLLNYYGLTETTGLCIGVPSDHTASARGTIGIAIGATIEVVDRKDNPLKYGETGELRVKSPNLMQGYYKNMELTNTVIRDGWFYTGDLAKVQEDGHVVLMGRKSDIIKDSHGTLIHPEEIENILEKHPMVREAGVCGYTAETGEERIAAFIVPKYEVSDSHFFFKTLSECIVKHLGPRKKPSKFFLHKKLQRSSSGKLLRRKLVGEIINGTNENT